MNSDSSPRLVTPAQTRWRRDVFDRLADHGWERMPAAFALPVSGAAADYRGALVPPGVAFSTSRRATSAMGSRTFTLRTLDLDFALVGRNRLRREGLNQRRYSLAHALHGEELLPDVLLAEAWVRGREFEPDPVLDVLTGRFGRVEHRIERTDRTLVRFRLAAWEPRDAD